MTDAIKDPELLVRMEAAGALMSIGPLAKDAAPALLAALQNAEDKAWYFFADALAKVDVATARQQAIPLIINAYDREKDVGTRFLLVSLLGELKAPPDAVAPTFIRALDDHHADSRTSAADSLGEIGPAAAAAIPKLTALLKDPNQDTREAAAKALERIRGK